MLEGGPKKNGVSREEFIYGKKGIAKRKQEELERIKYLDREIQNAEKYFRENKYRVQADGTEKHIARIQELKNERNNLAPKYNQGKATSSIYQGAVNSSVPNYVITTDDSNPIALYNSPKNTVKPKGGSGSTSNQRESSDDFTIQKVKPKEFDGFDVNSNVGLEQVINQGEDGNSSTDGTKDDGYNGSLYKGKEEKDSYLRNLDNATNLGNSIDAIAAGVNIADMKNNAEQEFSSNIPLISRSSRKVSAPDIKSSLYRKIDANVARGINVARGSGRTEQISGIIADANNTALEANARQGALNLQANAQTMQGEAQDKAFVEGTNTKILSDRENKRIAFEEKKAAYDRAGKQSLYTFGNNALKRSMNKNIQTNKYLTQKQLIKDSNEQALVDSMFGTTA